MSRRAARLSSGSRLALAVLVSIVVIGASTVAAFAAVIYHAGTVEVEVVETDGQRFSLSVPSTLVHGALRLAPLCLPSDIVEDVADEIGPWWPALRRASDEIVRGPDAVYVEVRGRGETVRVAKHGGALVIDVRDGDERVHVSVPVGLVSVVMDGIEHVAVR